MTEDSDWQPGVVFTHTLSLTLDDEAQEVLRDVRNRLMAAGIPVLHEPAHVTVAAVSTTNGVDSDLVDVGWPERVTLTTSCQLPNSDGVVALCPHHPTRPDVTRPKVAWSDTNAPVPAAVSGPLTPTTICDTSPGKVPNRAPLRRRLTFFAPRGFRRRSGDPMRLCIVGWPRWASPLSTITGHGGGIPTSRWGTRFRLSYGAEQSSSWPMSCLSRSG